MTTVLHKAPTAAGLTMILLLAGCSGATTTSTQSTTSTSSLQFAGFVVEKSEVSASGVISGVPTSATKVVTSGTDGYAYATTLLNGASFAQTGASADDQVFIAVAGITDSTNLGTPPTNGTATYNGNYELTYVAKPADGSAPSTANFETATGTVKLEANFSTNTITPTTSATTGETLTLKDFLSIGNSLQLIANYRDVTGTARGQIGTNRAVAGMAGSGTTGVFAGGFIADR